MISAGLEGRLPYMTYPEPWRNHPPKQPHEVFLRPAPKLLPPSTRTYNGATTTTYPNGTRLVPSRPHKYASPPSSGVPVNLTQPKEEPEEPMSPYSPYRLFPSHQFTFPYPPSLISQPYLRTPTNFPPTPLSPQEIFSPGTPTASSTGTFLPPPATFSPPSSTIVKPVQAVSRDKRTPPVAPGTPTSTQHSPSFKVPVPSGKEGSMKHRLLSQDNGPIRHGAMDLQRPSEGRKRLQATISPPRSPKKPLNNNTSTQNFNKGQLIQLASGEFRRIEEMRTEDFIQSAEKSPALRLAESTVVRIEERVGGSMAVTLTYDHRRAQVEIDSTPEHPYFVMGQGWASCSPERTMMCYGLKVHRLQVGDVLVSLTPRKEVKSAVSAPHPASRGSTIMTTATTTAMTSRQLSVNAGSSLNHNNNGHPLHLPPPPAMSMTSSSHHGTPPVMSMRAPNAHQEPINLHCASAGAQQQLRSLSPECASSRKRRWSAPDHVLEEEERRREEEAKRRVE